MAGQIAQLIVPADGGGNPLLVVPDWDRSRIYFVSDAVLRSYYAALETQSPILSSQAFNSAILGADVDPVTGALLIQRPNNGAGLTNATPLFRVDPSSFAVTGTFGGTGPSPSWPGSFWGVQSVSCVGCGRQASGGAVLVGYAFLKEGAFSGYVGVVRTDTMQQAGFYAPVVSGSTNNRGFLCRGASGATGASAFLTWNLSPEAPTLPLYTVTISPGAETYDSASWPATNPHIQSRTIGTFAATAVDATWSTMAAISLGYDATDGNVLLVVGTSAAVTNKRYVVKVAASNATVLWKTPLPVGPYEDPGLLGYDMDHNILGVIGTADYGLISGDTGTLTANPFGGIFPWGTFHAGSQAAAGSLASDTAALYFVAGTYNSTVANAPTPVAGTPGSFTAGYALIGGLIPTPLPPAPKPKLWLLRHPEHWFIGA